MSNHVAEPPRPASATRPNRLQDVVLGLSPLLLGGQIIFWFVFLPIGLRGDADFSMYYTAGAMVRTGHSHQLYDYQLQLQFERAHVSQTPAPYTHLPYEALPFVPLSLLSYRAAYITFLFFQLALAILAYALIREPAQSRWLPAALFIAYFPVAATIADGQDSIVLLVIAASAWRSYSRKQDWLSGALLALGLFRFNIVLPIAGAMFLWKRWRFTAGFGVVSAAVLGLSTWMVGVSQMRLYAAHLLSLSGVAGQEAGYYSMSHLIPRLMNLRGFFVNIVRTPHFAQALILISSLVLLAWVARRGFRITRKHQFAIAVAFSVLVSYHLFLYDLTILLIPMMATLAFTEQQHSRLATTAVLLPLIAVPVCLLWHPFLFALPLLVLLWILMYLFDARTDVAANQSVT